MRLVAVTRLLDEEELVEPFVRHHAGFVAAHIFLDNGSGDRSLAILAALKDEGFPLTVYRNETAIYMEPIFNTALMRAAFADGVDADWAVFLDCDEFVDDRAADGGLHGALSRLPPEAPCAELPMMSYLAPTTGTAQACNVVERFVLRRAAADAAAKVVVRRPGDLAGLTVAAGAHFLLRDGVKLPSAPLPGVCLAHYAERNAVQIAGKAVVGWLKVLATGREGAEAAWSRHYVGAFEALRDDAPGCLEAFEAALAARPAAALVLDPLPYRGETLLHTRPGDPIRRVTATILRHAERLAKAHGRLVDGAPAASRQMVAEGSAFVRLL